MSDNHYPIRYTGVSFGYCGDYRHFRIAISAKANCPFQANPGAIRVWFLDVEREPRLQRYRRSRSDAANLNRGDLLKKQIEAALRGLPLTDCWRPNIKGFESVQRFEFGVQSPFTTRRGRHLTFGAYALHVGCPWRIIGQGRILAAYIDLYYPADNPTESGGNEDFDAYKPGASQRDRQTQHFVERLEASPLFVERIIAEEVGSVSMDLGRGYQLEILPMDSLPFEFWRLLKTRKESNGEDHFVVTRRGIEENIREG